MRAEVETLDCGMKAVFAEYESTASRSGSEVTSARLVFNVGALHERAPITPGTAHFLEHVAILGGTASYPTPKQLHNASNISDLELLGYTDWTSTYIETNGRRANFVVAMTLEMGFLPKITPRGVEQDRKAISEEARGYTHNIWSPAVDSVSRLFAGEHPSRTISGTVDNTRQISHRDIVDFHRNFWVPSNATLYVVSNKPVDKVRNYTNRVLGQIFDGPLKAPAEPMKLDLPWLNSTGETISMDCGVDAEQQAEVLVLYPLETPKTFEEYVLDVAATDLVRNALWRFIRVERNITYHAWAETFGISNTCHGAKEFYNSLFIESAIQPQNAHLVVDSIDRLAEMMPKFKTLAGNVLREYTYWLDAKGAYTVCELADDLILSEQVSYKKEYAPKKEIKVVKSLATGKLIQRAQEMLQGSRVVHIAEPTGSRGLEVIAANKRLKSRRR